MKRTLGSIALCVLSLALPACSRNTGYLNEPYYVRLPGSDPRMSPPIAVAPDPRVAISQPPQPMPSPPMPMPQPPAPPVKVIATAPPVPKAEPLNPLPPLFDDEGIRRKSQPIQTVNTPAPSPMEPVKIPVIGNSEPPILTTTSHTPQPTVSIEPISAPDWPDPRKQPITAKPTTQLPSDPAAKITLPGGKVSTEDSPLVKLARAMQGKNPAEAQRLLAAMDPAEREVLTPLLPVLHKLSDPTAGGLSAEDSVKLAEGLQQATARLKAQAPLKAERVCFCRGVRKYGDFDPYEAGHAFRPGDMLHLYAELKNFTCEPLPEPDFGVSIKLATRLEIVQEDKVLVRYDLTKTDAARTPPSDYYHTYRFCIPDSLPAGAYKLRMTLTDQWKNPAPQTVHEIDLRIVP